MMAKSGADSAKVGGVGQLRHEIGRCLATSANSGSDSAICSGKCCRFWGGDRLLVDFRRRADSNVPPIISSGQIRSTSPKLTRSPANLPSNSTRGLDAVEVGQGRVKLDQSWVDHRRNRSTLLGIDRNLPDFDRSGFGQGWGPESASLGKEVSRIRLVPRAAGHPAALHRVAQSSWRARPSGAGVTARARGLWQGLHARLAGWTPARLACSPGARQEWVAPAACCGPAKGRYRGLGAGPSCHAEWGRPGGAPTSRLQGCRTSLPCGGVACPAPATSRPPSTHAAAAYTKGSVFDGGNPLLARGDWAVVLVDQSPCGGFGRPQTTPRAELQMALRVAEGSAGWVPIATDCEHVHAGERASAEAPAGAAAAALIEGLNGDWPCMAAYPLLLQWVELVGGNWRHRLRRRRAATAAVRRPPPTFGVGARLRGGRQDVDGHALFGAQALFAASAHERRRRPSGWGCARCGRRLARRVQRCLSRSCGAKRPDEELAELAIRVALARMAGFWQWAGRALEGTGAWPAGAPPCFLREHTFDASTGRPGADDARPLARRGRLRVARRLAEQGRSMCVWPRWCARRGRASGARAAGRPRALGAGRGRTWRAPQHATVGSRWKLGRVRPEQQPG